MRFKRGYKSKTKIMSMTMLAAMSEMVILGSQVKGK
jgi:hypothetical protein